MRFLLLALACALTACTKPAAETPFPSEPRCPSLVNKDLWQKNFDHCIAPYRADPEKKDFTMEQAEATCRCVSNGIFYAPTCEELRAYTSGTEAVKNAFMQNVVNNCKDYLPALKDKTVTVK
jgi:hypothetical protein